MSVKVRHQSALAVFGRNVVARPFHNPEIEFVAVNDLTDTKTLAHLTKYDSVLGQLHEERQDRGRRASSSAPGMSKSLP